MIKCVSNKANLILLITKGHISTVFNYHVRLTRGGGGMGLDRGRECNWDSKFSEEFTTHHEKPLVDLFKLTLDP